MIRRRSEFIRQAVAQVVQPAQVVPAGKGAPAGQAGGAFALRRRKARLHLGASGSLVPRWPALRKT